VHNIPPGLFKGSEILVHPVVSNNPVFTLLNPHWAVDGIGDVVWVELVVRGLSSAGIKIVVLVVKELKLI